MMQVVEQMPAHLQETLAAQKFAALSTHRAGEAHASLIAFATTEDLKGLVFATDRATRKYANLRENARIALLIDTRSNQEEDLRDAVAITASGMAREVAGREREALLVGYLRKHPQLSDFVNAPTSALILLDVLSYSIVSRFQDIVEWRIA